MTGLSSTTIDGDRTPLYIQLATSLRNRIVDDEIASGRALPSERELCHMTGASRVTVRKAISLLIDEGLLTRRQGSGTFVAQRIEAQGNFLSSFSEDAAARGEESGTIWLTKVLGTAAEDEARMLGLDKGATVVRLGRVRLASGEPLAHENATVPAEMLPDVDAIDGSLYAALATQGNRPVTGTQRIRAALATAIEAQLLAIPELSEVLQIERLTRRADGRAVELTRSFYRGDRYDFVSELRGGFSIT